MSITSPLPTLRLPEVPTGTGPDLAAPPGSGPAGAMLPAGGIAGPGTAAPGPSAPRAAAAASTLPNPSLRLDASLGLVVLEFRDADGTARTIPNERELEAYRSAARAHRIGQPGTAADAAES